MTTAVDRSALMHTYRDPSVTFVKGSGTRLYDAAGKEYLDFVSGLAVTSLGHCHPAVADAVALQARTLEHVSNLYGNTLAPDVASTIDRLIGGGEERVGGQVFFSNSGAEAIECAIKLARRYSGGRGANVVSAFGGFHGRTLAALAATGQIEKHAGFEPMPAGFSHVPYDDVDALVDAVSGPGVIAVLLEPIQGEGGVVVPSSDYLRAARRICDESGALMIVDEVQTGFGRTGSWFAFQRLGLVPDVVTMSKALGNGFPVGACWAKAEVAAAFGPGDHGSTFGGQPLAMAAVRATLDVMERENVCERARVTGEYLRRSLLTLPGVKEVRGEGLLLAAVFNNPIAGVVAANAESAGVLVNPVRRDTLRLAPPLLVSNDDVDAAVGVIRGVLRSLP